MRKINVKKEDCFCNLDTDQLDILNRVLNALFPKGKIDLEEIRPLPFREDIQPYGWGDSVFTELLSQLDINIYGAYKKEIKPVLRKIFCKYGDNIELNGCKINEWGNREINVTAYNIDYVDEDPNSFIYANLAASW